ncbi:S-adenosylmethionine carrier 1, chloroplastic/mitochondrial-like isoform X4 [Rosa rugosa]|uniref:S-adenosylmethionine carrier 1, chloroplastic/mitochondrial-like isoform X4 n=1 Tax=Rosa rugosa TaxID=74645 RepID=UPI002B403876|nr:S-adenosylmethionine carrier 1, chloroplastic/mitochondrial-like isoform X4 [Rosa rugosa]XP_062007175.1 S-adenosylmethionine carrier 1, chloroplastic/mitochondrial-like isoform X4 [Rosa rugosa]
MAKRKSFASVSMQDDKPFDCLRTLFDCGDLWRHAASLIRAPTEVVKQRMQTGQFTSASAAVRLIAAKEGFKGLYAGYGSFLLRDLPFDAIQFCLYGQLRIGYKVAAKRELNDPENAIIGAFAGALTGAITTPLDVIKTRLMVQLFALLFFFFFFLKRDLPTSTKELLTVFRLL